VGERGSTTRLEKQRRQMEPPLLEGRMSVDRYPWEHVGGGSQ
jgi:hypothetical protein